MEKQVVQIFNLYLLLAGSKRNFEKASWVGRVASHPLPLTLPSPPPSPPSYTEYVQVCCPLTSKCSHVFLWKK